MYVTYDEKSRNPKMQEELLEEFKSLDIIQEAALRGKMTAKLSNQDEVNLSGEYIWSFAPVTRGAYSLGQLVQEYQNKGVVKGYTITSENIGGKEKLTLLIETDYRIIPYDETKAIPLGREAVISDFAGIDENIRKLQKQLAFEEAFAKTKRSQGAVEVSIKNLTESAETPTLGSILNKAHDLSKVKIERITTSKSGLLSDPIDGYIQVLSNGKKIIVLPSYASDY